MLPPSVALHGWTIGAIALMTLAVMTRATLGHTGRALAAGPATLAIYLAAGLAVVARLAVPFLPDLTMPLLDLAASAWVLAFAGYVVVYGPMLAGPRPSCTSRRRRRSSHKVETLRRQRWTGKQIAAELGISPATVSRILRRLGLNRIAALWSRPNRSAATSATMPAS